MKQRMYAQLQQEAEMAYNLVVMKLLHFPDANRISNDDVEDEDYEQFVTR